jgi:ankyrin repeat protein
VTLTASPRPPSRKRCEPPRAQRETERNGETLETTKLLLDAGAEVNECCSNGQTALHFASHNPEMVELLLEAGAEVNAADQDGDTPLCAAARSGFLDAIKILCCRVYST